MYKTYNDSVLIDMDYFFMTGGDDTGIGTFFAQNCRIWAFLSQNRRTGTFLAQNCRVGAFFPSIIH